MVRIHCNDRTSSYCCRHLHEYSAYKRLGPNFHSVVYTVAWQYPIVLNNHSLYINIQSLT